VVETPLRRIGPSVDREIPLSCSYGIRNSFSPASGTSSRHYSANRRVSVEAISRAGSFGTAARNISTMRENFLADEPSANSRLKAPAPLAWTITRPQARGDDLRPTRLDILWRPRRNASPGDEAYRLISTVRSTLRQEHRRASAAAPVRPPCGAAPHRP